MIRNSPVLGRQTPYPSLWQPSNPGSECLLAVPRLGSNVGLSTKHRLTVSTPLGCAGEDLHRCSCHKARHRGSARRRADPTASYRSCRQNHGPTRLPSTGARPRSAPGCNWPLCSRNGPDMPRHPTAPPKPCEFPIPPPNPPFTGARPPHGDLVAAVTVIVPRHRHVAVLAPTNSGEAADVPNTGCRTPHLPRQRGLAHTFLAQPARRNPGGDRRLSLANQAPGRRFNRSRCTARQSGQTHP